MQYYPYLLSDWEHWEYQQIGIAYDAGLASLVSVDTDDWDIIEIVKIEFHGFIYTLIY